MNDYFPVESDTEEQKMDILVKAISLVVTEPILDATRIAFSNAGALLAVKWDKSRYTAGYSSAKPLVDPDLAGDLGPIYEQDSFDYAINIKQINSSIDWRKLTQDQAAVYAQEWWSKTVSIILERAIPLTLLERTAVKSCTIPIIGVHTPIGLYTQRAIEVPTFDLIGE